MPIELDNFEKDGVTRAARLAGMVDNIPGYIFQRIRTEDGLLGFSYFSPSYWRLLGVEEPESLDDFDILQFIDQRDRERVRAAVEQSLVDLTPTTAEYRIKSADGKERWLRTQATPRVLLDGSTVWDGVGTDITAEKAAEGALTYLAYHDPLTGLYNRLSFNRRLAVTATAISGKDSVTAPSFQNALPLDDDYIVEELALQSDWAALLLVDLENFKSVNKDFGHAAGDDVLQQVARKLVSRIEPTDTVARVGGDEFAILLLGINDHPPAPEIAEALIHAIAQPIVVGDAIVSIGASIGSAMFSKDSAGLNEILSNADLALLQAKTLGRYGHAEFTPAFREQADRARAYDSDLRRAFKLGEFVVFYQPQVRLIDGAVVGAEALLRWSHPRDGLLSPGSFMTALESRPLSADVGRWVLRTACVQAKAWRDSIAADFRMGVNLFGSQFRIGNLAGEVEDALGAAGLPGSALELEITENIMLRYDESTLRPLNEVRELGVGVAFDDFGTGFGSLSMLRRFPVSRLKIDSSFVRDMCEVQEDAAIIRCILLLGQSLGLDVIAEGIETPGQAEFLRREGCVEAQGYFYGRPMSADDFSRRLGGACNATAR